jgi:hypothetical protein
MAVLFLEDAMPRLCACLLLVGVGAGAAACSSTPASPSPLGGVTINGSIVSPGGGAASTASVGGPSAPASVPPGLVVSVTNTGLSTAVDALGRFSLLNVPPGNPELRFSAPGGLSLSARLSNVQAGESVTIEVSLGETAVIESERRSLGPEEQLEGRVEAIPPDTAPLTIVVAGRTVVTNATTLFYLRGSASSFDAITVGARVHVKGQPSGDTLVARLVNIQNPGLEGTDFEGVISAKTGTAPDLTLTIGSLTVLTNADTKVRRKGDLQDPSVLQIGMTVTGNGWLQPDGTVIAKQIHIEGDAVGGEFQMTGNMGALSGSCPAVTFKVAGYTIVTASGTTTFVPNCTSLSNGTKVLVKGVVQADGTIAATRVEKK